MKIAVHKNFDGWNEEKKRLHGDNRLVYAYPREIWWCALGVNIGAETDGKNTNFERPVLAMRIYNKDTLLVLPITTREKNDKFHCAVRAKSSTVWIKLTQARVISHHRLVRKLDILSVKEFEKVRQAFKKYI